MKPGDMVRFEWGSVIVTGIVLELRPSTAKYSPFPMIEYVLEVLENSGKRNVYDIYQGQAIEVISETR